MASKGQSHRYRLIVIGAMLASCEDYVCAVSVSVSCGGENLKGFIMFYCFYLLKRELDCGDMMVDRYPVCSP